MKERKERKERKEEGRRKKEEGGRRQGRREWRVRELGVRPNNF
jgi:hypothetical protein